MENNNSQNKERKLKVYPKYRAQAYKNVIVPEIRLSGKWLQESGFNYGQSVNVKHELNRIVITLKKEE